MTHEQSFFAMNRRVVLSALALVPALQPRLAAAQQTQRGGDLAFSFAVYGDSRSMMYLPYKWAQREEAIKLMVDMFDLVLREGLGGSRQKGRQAHL